MIIFPGPLQAFSFIEAAILHKISKSKQLQYLKGRKYLLFSFFNFLFLSNNNLCYTYNFNYTRDIYLHFLKFTIPRYMIESF